MIIDLVRAEKICKDNVDFIIQTSDILEAYHPAHNRWVRAFFVTENIPTLPNQSSLDNLLQITYKEVSYINLDLVLPECLIKCLDLFHLLKN